MSESSERKLPADRVKNGKEGTAITAITLNQPLCSPAGARGYEVTTCGQNKLRAAYEQGGECVTQEEGRMQTSLQGKRASRSVPDCTGDIRPSVGTVDEYEL